MAGVSAQGIFISYRRQDAAPYARLLKQGLNERFPDVQVFIDLDSIEGGRDFAEVITEALNSSKVLVALIGRQWVTLADKRGQRLNNPDDFVRFEVHTALERGIRVIPVLIDGAEPLRPEELPAELHKLARLNAVELSSSRYEYDAGQLFTLIEGVLAAASTEPPVVPDDKGPEPRLSDRAIRVLAEAESITQYMTNERVRAQALADIASALSAADPSRASRLIADAEDSARVGADEYQRDAKLGEIAEALAVTNPDQAERIAQAIPNWYGRHLGLASVAKALAATQPERAERIALSIVRELEGSQLDGVMNVLAVIDPDDAERVARSLVRETRKCRALVAVAGVLTATDPDRSARLISFAERIARSIVYESEKISALVGMVEALVPIDPDQAARIGTDVENLVRSSPYLPQPDFVLSRVAEALAIIDPDRAERIARSNVDDSVKQMPRALVHIAKALAATDPDRALDLARSIDNGWGPYTNEALVHIAGTLAATDPDRAESLAESLPDENSKSSALVKVAKAVAATDPDRAERIAQAIPHEYWKVSALVAIAEAPLA